MFYLEGHKVPPTYTSSPKGKNTSNYSPLLLSPSFVPNQEHVPLHTHVLKAEAVCSALAQHVKQRNVVPVSATSDSYPPTNKYCKPPGLQQLKDKQ